MSKDESIIIKNGLNSLAKFQDQMDAVTWQISDPDMAKFRHISLHIARISGSLADITHKWEHEQNKDPQTLSDSSIIDREVLQNIIADLIIHAFQLSNMIEANAYDALSQRVARNIQRFAPDSEVGLD